MKRNDLFVVLAIGLILPSFLSSQEIHPINQKNANLATDQMLRPMTLDLGIDGPNAGIYFHAGTIPGSFLRHPEYSTFTPGLKVRNFGTVSDSNAMVEFTIELSGSGGSLNKIEFQSHPLGLLLPGDSLLFIGNQCDSLDKYSIPIEGNLSFQHKIITLGNDINPINNNSSNNVSLTSAHLSKSRWDFNNNRPVVNLHRTLHTPIEKQISTAFTIPANSFDKLINLTGYVGMATGTLDDLLMDIAVFLWTDWNGNGRTDKDDKYELLSFENKHWNNSNQTEEFFKIPLTDFNNGSGGVELPKNKELNIIASIKFLTIQPLIIGFDTAADYSTKIEQLVSTNPIRIVDEPYVLGDFSISDNKGHKKFENFNAGLSLGLEFCCHGSVDEEIKQFTGLEIKSQLFENSLQLQYVPGNYKSPAYIQIFSIDGRKLNSMYLDKQEHRNWNLPLNTIPAGIYYISVKTNRESVSKPIYIMNPY